MTNKPKSPVEEAFVEFLRQEYDEITTNDYREFGAESKRVRDEKNAFYKGAKWLAEELRKTGYPYICPRDIKRLMGEE